MFKGDLSNEAAPRMLFVWEGLVARTTRPSERIKLRVSTQRRAWRRAVEAHVTDTRMAARLHDLNWRHHFSLELVTFLGAGFPDPERDELEGVLRARIDRERLPVSWIRVPTSAGDFARSLAAEPQIARVFDPDPQRAAAYGASVGRWLSDPAVFDWKN